MIALGVGNLVTLLEEDPSNPGGDEANGDDHEIPEGATAHRSWCGCSRGDSRCKKRRDTAEDDGPFGSKLIVDDTDEKTKDGEAGIESDVGVLADL